MKPNLLLLVSFTAALIGSPHNAEAQAPAAATPAPAGALGAKTALSKTELRKLFEDTEWVAGANGGGHFFFHRDGKLNGTQIGKRKFYTVEAPDILKIYEKDPSKDRKAEFEMFRVNVVALIAEADAPGSTKTGNGGPPLKYVGPAPKK